MCAMFVAPLCLRAVGSRVCVQHGDVELYTDMMMPTGDNRPNQTIQTPTPTVRPPQHTDSQRMRTIAPWDICHESIIKLYAVYNIVRACGIVRRGPITATIKC